MPKIFIYTRSSTSRQEISCKAQEQIVRSYIDVKRQFDWKDHEIAGVFTDHGVSSQVPLLERPEGSKMMLSISKGDVIVASHLSRMFRSTLECVKFLETITATGIDFVVLDANFDTSTAAGMACLKVMAVFAELESRTCRDRIKTALAWKESQGLPITGCPPFGWNIIGRKRNAVFMPVHEDREAAKYAAYLFYYHNIPRERVARRMREQGISVTCSDTIDLDVVKTMLLRWRYFAIKGEWSKLGRDKTTAAVSHEWRQLSHEDRSTLAYRFAPVQKPEDHSVPA